MFDIVENARIRIIDTMNQALIVVDANKHFLEANQKAKEIYSKLYDFEKGDKIELPKELEYMNEYEFQFEKKGKYYEGEINPIFFEEKLQGYTICIFDATEKKKTIEQLVAMRDEAERANRAKSRFLSNMSHELRTPLNAIIGMSEILLRKSLQADIRYDLQSIYYSSQNLLGLVNNLLDISKIEAEKLELEAAEYYFDSLLYEVVNIIFISLAGKKIEFKIIIKENVPKQLVGDLVHIRGILFNLLGNAVKYTREGHIYLYIDWESQQKSEQGFLHFSVEDTGIGIKEENLKSIFKEYEQIHSEDTKGITGTGLGLSITRQIVEMMGGKISVKSQYGKGSTFSAYISQGVKNPEVIGKQIITKENIVSILERDRFEKEEKANFPDQWVLIVDDMKVNQTVLKGLIEPYHVKIDTADSGREAIKLIQKKDYGLIFMDQMMPEMDGLETLKVIRSLSGEKYQKLPVILVTANVIGNREKELMKYGFQDYICKPISVRRLIRLLKKWLGKDTKELPFDEQNMSAVTVEKQINIESWLGKIDRQEGINHVGGQEALYKEVLKAYYHDGQKVILKLKQAESMEHSALTVLVHGIKGSSYNIGAVKLGKRAEHLEATLRKGDVDYVMRQLPFFIMEIEEILSLISETFETTETAVLKRKKKINEEVISLLAKLRGEFDAYNIEGVEKILKQLNQFDYGEEAEEKIELLNLYMQDLEYEAGVELLDKWLEKKL